MRGAEDGCSALEVKRQFWLVENRDWRGGRRGRLEGLNGGELTERRLRLSSRWRGTTVTISISQRKATSIGVRPACRGNAIIILGCVSC